MADFGYRATLRVALGAVFLCCASCGGGGGNNRQACYPVAGELFVAGQPAAGALIVLFPKQNPVAAEWEKGFPHGRVDSAGSFRIETYVPGDGAPAGEYAALITWPNENSDEDADSSERDRLRGQYADPARSTLAVLVSEQANNGLKRWDLK